MRRLNVDRLRAKYLADAVQTFDSLPLSVRRRLALDDELRDLYHSLAWLSANEATTRDLSWMRRRNS